MGGCSAKVAPTTSLSSSANKKTLNGELPAHWSTVAAKEYQSNGFCAVKLSKDDNVWQQLERFLEVDDAQNLGRGRDTQQKAQQKYDRLRLAAAWRVQNPALWSRYVAGKAKIRRDVHGLQKLGKGLPKRGGPGLPLRLHDRAKATVEAALPGEKLDDEVKGRTAPHTAHRPRYLQCILDELMSACTARAAGQGNHADARLEAAVPPRYTKQRTERAVLWSNRDTLWQRHVLCRGRR